MKLRMRFGSNRLRGRWKYWTGVAAEAAAEFRDERAGAEPPLRASHFSAWHPLEAVKRALEA